MGESQIQMELNLKNGPPWGFRMAARDNGQVFVSQVLLNGCADQAGLEVGDLIEKMAGCPMTDLEKAHGALRNASGTLCLAIKRENNDSDISLINENDPPKPLKPFEGQTEGQRLQHYPFQGAYLTTDGYKITSELIQSSEDHQKTPEAKETPKNLNSTQFLSENRPEKTTSGHNLTVQDHLTVDVRHSQSPISSSPIQSPESHQAELINSPGSVESHKQASPILERSQKSAYNNGQALSQVSPQGLQQPVQVDLQKSVTYQGNNQEKNPSAGRRVLSPIPDNSQKIGQEIAVHNQQRQASPLTNKKIFAQPTSPVAQPKFQRPPQLSTVTPFQAYHQASENLAKSCQDLKQTSEGLKVEESQNKSPLAQRKLPPEVLPKPPVVSRKPDAENSSIESIDPQEHQVQYLEQQESQVQHPRPSLATLEAKLQHFEEKIREAEIPKTATRPDDIPRGRINLQVGANDSPKAPRSVSLVAALSRKPPPAQNYLGGFRGTASDKKRFFEVQAARLASPPRKMGNRRSRPKSVTGYGSRTMANTPMFDRDYSSYYEYRSENSTPVNYFTPPGIQIPKNNLSHSITAPESSSNIWNGNSKQTMEEVEQSLRTEGYQETVENSQNSKKIAPTPPPKPKSRPNSCIGMPVNEMTATPISYHVQTTQTGLVNDNNNNIQGENKTEINGNIADKEKKEVIVTNRSVEVEPVEQKPVLSRVQTPVREWSTITAVRKEIPILAQPYSPPPQMPRFDSPEPRVSNNSNVDQIRPLSPSQPSLPSPNASSDTGFASNLSTPQVKPEKKVTPLAPQDTNESSKSSVDSAVPPINTLELITKNGYAASCEETEEEGISPMRNVDDPNWYKDMFKKMHVIDGNEGRSILSERLQRDQHLAPVRSPLIPVQSNQFAHSTEDLGGFEADPPRIRALDQVRSPTDDFFAQSTQDYTRPQDLQVQDHLQKGEEYLQQVQDQLEEEMNGRNSRSQSVPRRYDPVADMEIVDRAYQTRKRSGIGNGGRFYSSQQLNGDDARLSPFDESYEEIYKNAGAIARLATTPNISVRRSSPSSSVCCLSPPPKVPPSHFHLPAHRLRLYSEDRPKSASGYNRSVRSPEVSWLEVEEFSERLGKPATKLRWKQRSLESVADQVVQHQIEDKLDKASKDLDKLLNDLQNQHLKALRADSGAFCSSRSTSSNEFTGFLQNGTATLSKGARELKRLQKEEMLSRQRAGKLTSELDDQRSRRHGYIPNVSPALQNNYNRLDQLLVDFDQPRRPATSLSAPQQRLMHSASAHSLNRRPATSNVITCTALYKFVAQHPRELSLNRGDVVRVHREVDDHWLEGERNGHIGIFPASYVQMESDPTTSGRNRVRAVYPFQARNPNELSLKAGEILKLRREIDANWVEGHNSHGAIGIFPRSYVRDLDLDDSDFSSGSGGIPDRPKTPKIPFSSSNNTFSRAARQKFERQLIQDFLCFGRMQDFELECSQTAKFHRKDSLKPEEETTPFKFHVEWLFPKLMFTSKR
uniref:PDZ domain-containing protein n=2 Tax=Bursaphelenchus xylophilus TaxID=6326 RepID=A0A1I7RI00_BURXY